MAFANTEFKTVMLEPSTPLINPHDNALELVINILLKVALPEDMVITPLGLAASVILSLLLAYVPLVFTNITPAAELLLSIFTLFVVKEEFLLIINAENKKEREKKTFSRAFRHPYQNSSF